MDRISQFKDIVSDITGDETIKTKYAEHLDELFDEVDAVKIGADFEDALKKEDYAKACKVLAKHYRNKPCPPLNSLTANGRYNQTSADRAIEGYAREVNIDWKFENGEIDFLFDPTAVLGGPINHEWLWQFNRHGAWSNMASAFVGTGDEKYALGLERQVLKWIAQTSIPERWNGPGSAWRTIECGIRLLGTWPVAYDGLRRSSKVNDITVILMISSFLKQAKHLVAHPTGANWLMMEMNGVYTFSAIFTELKCSTEYRKTAANYLLKELSAQILPDGMHNELSPDYQSVVLGCAANFLELARALGMENEVPEEFGKLIKETVAAAVALSTPAFTQPRTNDCYTIPTDRFTRRAEAIFGKDPMWSFVNTNRAEGDPPKGETASKFLPYAGFVAMRSDWGADATYMSFDVGPLGTNHMHQDKLNINIFKGSEELIYDDGGGQYEISKERGYACSAYGHNTVLVDGRAQNRKGPKQMSDPIDAGFTSNDVFDYACAVYDDTFGAEMVTNATHKREVRFCKPDFFVVSDTLTSVDGNTHKYEALFHLDTTRVNKLEGLKNAVVSDFGRRYDIVIIPLDCNCAEPFLSIVSAQKEPSLKGWYNGRNEANLHPSTTVSRTVSGVKDYRFNTLFIPIEKGQALPVVTADGNGKYTVSFPQPTKGQAT